MLFGSSEVPRRNFQQNICDIWRGSSLVRLRSLEVGFHRDLPTWPVRKSEKALLPNANNGTRRRANVPRSQQLIRHRAPHRAPSKRPHRKFRPEPSFAQSAATRTSVPFFTRCCVFSGTPPRDWVRPRFTNKRHPNQIIRRAPSWLATKTRLESRTPSGDVRTPRWRASPGSPFITNFCRESGGHTFSRFPLRNPTIPLPPAGVLSRRTFATSNTPLGPVVPPSASPP